jgi:hypothetical protein
VWKTFYSFFDKLLNMLKKDITVQSTLILAISGGLWWLSAQELRTNNILLDIPYNNLKNTFPFVAVILWIPLLINLLLQTFSKEKVYNESIYYKVLKYVIHYSILILGSYVLGILLALTQFLLLQVNQFILVSVVSIIIIFLMLGLIYSFFKMRFKYNIFSPKF